MITRKNIYAYAPKAIDSCEYLTFRYRMKIATKKLCKYYKIIVIGPASSSLCEAPLYQVGVALLTKMISNLPRHWMRIEVPVFELWLK